VPGESCAGRFDAEVAWLRKCHAVGATMASACSGAVLLAEAGLLDGLDATIHWAYGETLTTNYPEIRVHPDRALVINGAEQRIVMGGGGTSWQDLTLFLIGRFVGLKEAMERLDRQIAGLQHLFRFLEPKRMDVFQRRHAGGLAEAADE
jgi:transcriptional regulator GlxA family with amidase domain